jgi:hypothetical protein
MVTLFVTHVQAILDYCYCVCNVGFCRGYASYRVSSEEMDKAGIWLSNVDDNARHRALDLFSIRGRLLRADFIKYWKILCCDTEGFDLSILFHMAVDVRM